MSLTIWCNTKFVEAANQRLISGTQAHRLIFSSSASASVLAAGTNDPSIGEADIAFGQPAVNDCLASPKLRWIELSSAGYTRYDTDEFKEVLRSRGTALTNASEVFADSCAQHVLAMILGFARQLPQSLKDQYSDRSWHWADRRYSSRLLTGQTVLMLGFGAIGRRLAELLAPFGVKMLALRRQTRSESAVRIIAAENISSALAEADHVVN
ncbi:MAG: NAD(P)-dependent oxidoreductase, partial [Opitutus sp.]